MGMRIKPLESLESPIVISSYVGSHSAFRHVQQSRHFVARQSHPREVHRVHFPLDPGMGMMKAFLLQYLHIVRGNGQTYHDQGLLVPGELPDIVFSIDSTKKGPSCPA